MCPVDSTVPVCCSIDVSRGWKGATSQLVEKENPEFACIFSKRFQKEEGYTVSCGISKLQRRTICSDGSLLAQEKGESRRNWFILV